MSALPVIGNLAWAPVPGIENVEVIDRFNGVPTLGVFTAGDERNLFWRVTGYVPKTWSVWLYVPLTSADEAHLADADGPDLLDGIIAGCGEPRWVTVGFAKDYRLLFEREWRLPQGSDANRIAGDALLFLADAMEIALEGDMPQARREIVFSTSEAIRELVADCA